VLELCFENLWSYYLAYTYHIFTHYVALLFTHKLGAILLDILSLKNTKFPMVHYYLYLRSKLKLGTIKKFKSNFVFLTLNF